MSAPVAPAGAGLRFRDVSNPADWPERERETHLVSGLLSTTLTVLAGAPAAGKTHYAVAMAAALLNGAPNFLGREVAQRLDSVAFVCTDADGAGSVRRRIGPLIAGEACGRVMVADYTAGSGVEWDAVAETVAGLAPGLLVVDNVLGVVADVNDNGEAQRVTAPLLRLTQQGTAVLLLTHTGKRGTLGPAHGVEAPIGARTWTVPARVKSTLTAHEKEQRRQIKAINNDSEPLTINASLDVTAGAPVWSLHTGDASATQRREVQATADDKWEELADRVVREQPAGVDSLRGLGRHYAVSLNLTPDHVKNQLSPLVRWTGDRWERKA